MLGFRLVDVGPELIVAVSDRRLAAAIREFTYHWEEAAQKRKDPPAELAEMIRNLKEVALGEAA